jgi:hypothetical protein
VPITFSYAAIYRRFAKGSWHRKWHRKRGTHMKLLCLFLVTFWLNPIALANDSIPVEYKFLVDKDSWKKAGKFFDIDQAKDRKVYFFDTEDRKLYSDNLIIRLRLSKKRNDFTIKIRPLDREQVDESWLSLLGFKCEFDVGIKKTNSSCSLRTEVLETTAQQVIAGGRPISDLMSVTQLIYIQMYWDGQIPWEQLITLGPIDTKKVKKLEDAFEEITLEVWKVEELEFWEVSFKEMRASLVGVKERQEQFIEFLKDEKIRPATEQVSKTSMCLSKL